MKKILLIFFSSIVLTALLTACSDGETYADMKKKERKAIDRFIENNNVIGHINWISESTFYAQDSTTDVSKNQFVRFNDDGIYMQIVRKGDGKSMVELAKEQPDSTARLVILSRFMEYDIKNADTTYCNYYAQAIVDKMICTYTHRGRSYTASFTEGYMKNYYGAMVPAGWLKPLNFIRLTRTAGREAKVRIIVPHASGTSNAQNYVLPYYYEITYQLGK